MSEESEEIATLLSAQLKAYPEELKRRHAQRLIRLNDAKAMLRDAAVRIDSQMPGVWRLLIAGAMDYAGHALLAFAGGLKSSVKKARLLDRLIKWAGIEAKATAPVAQKFAAFFGVRTTIGKGVWGTLLSFVVPSQDKVAAEVVINGFNLIAIRRLTEMVDSSCLPDDGSGVPHGYSERVVCLKQRPRADRVRKVVRSHKPRRRRNGRSRMARSN